MADLIENPVINSPFAEPERPFRFSDSGITDEIVPGRRRWCISSPSPSIYSRADDWLNLYS